MQIGVEVARRKILVQLRTAVGHHGVSFIGEATSETHGSMCKWNCADRLEQKPFAPQCSPRHIGAKGCTANQTNPEGTNLCFRVGNNEGFSVESGF